MLSGWSRRHSSDETRLVSEKKAHVLVRLLTTCYKSESFEKRVEKGALASLICGQARGAFSPLSDDG